MYPSFYLDYYRGWTNYNHLPNTWRSNYQSKILLSNRRLHGGGGGYWGSALLVSEIYGLHEIFRLQRALSTPWKNLSPPSSLWKKSCKRTFEQMNPSVVREIFKIFNNCTDDYLLCHDDKVIYTWWIMTPFHFKNLMSILYFTGGGGGTNNFK